MFGDDDGEHGTDDHQPPRGERREGQGDQPGGDDGRAVGQEQANGFFWMRSMAVSARSAASAGDDQLDQDAGPTSQA